MIFSNRKYKLTESELLAKYAQSHRTHWIGELFSRHAHLVLGVCLKYLKNEPEAKDATLEVFEKLLEELKTKSVDQFEPWVYTVAKNHCLMVLRKQSAQKKHLERLNGSEPDTIDDKILLEVKIDHLHEAIDSLNEDQATSIRLFYLERLSYEQVAHQTGYSVKQVKSFIQNGKRNLKIKLSQKDEFAV